MLHFFHRGFFAEISPHDLALWDLAVRGREGSLRRNFDSALHGFPRVELGELGQGPFWRGLRARRDPRCSTEYGYGLTQGQIAFLDGVEEGNAGNKRGVALLGNLFLIFLVFTHFLNCSICAYKVQWITYTPMVEHIPRVDSVTTVNPFGPHAYSPIVDSILI